MSSFVFPCHHMSWSNFMLFSGLIVACVFAFVFIELFVCPISFSIVYLRGPLASIEKTVKNETRVGMLNIVRRSVDQYLFETGNTDPEGGWWQ